MHHLIRALPHACVCTVLGLALRLHYSRIRFAGFGPALRAVSAAYFDTVVGPRAEPLVPRYTKPLRTDPNAALRRGYTLALGALPRAQLRARLTEAVGALVRASEAEEDADLRDPETRRNAVLALASVASTVGLAASDELGRAKTDRTGPYITDS